LRQDWRLRWLDRSASKKLFSTHSAASRLCCADHDVKRSYSLR
jgi:hypothetical protein